MSSFTFVSPEAVTAAAAELAEIGSTVSSANAAAAVPTTQVIAAASDEVSTAIAALFSTSGQQFQALSAQAATIHGEFVKLLSGGAAQYVSTELANAQQTLANAIGVGQSAVSAAETQTVLPPLSFPTPFGEFALNYSEVYPDGLNGPLSSSLRVTTPLGSLVWETNGIMSETGKVITTTGGTLITPPAVPFLAALAGPYITGGASLSNSTNAFFNAVQTGNPLGAAVAWLGAPFNFTGAVLFGHETISIPLGEELGAYPRTFHIPFGGLFAPAQPIRVTSPDYTIDNPIWQPGVQATSLAHDIAYSGTQFGGFFPVLLNTIVSTFLR
ncbi:PE family protein [Mycobacterium intermedium]|uniref:PE family protein n=1 Tax=Mycobacterium intermedium TaxID=28445 RepID=A0A1E3SGV0_MYCIE|nr:PE family protein [Mycobacterium intermedium]MCV6964511.1 PE family protein [Mycobacterium intermedium]ODR01325.1 hypothetical protein BHQ20_09060 [Mycobacterium intermedium]OPE52576.1 PE family protein [Mycobacterium intermedium]ORB07437.1 PE family protein [Mycobacterium intermedium]